MTEAFDVFATLAAEDFGAALRTMRQAAGNPSTFEIGARSGISPASVSKYLRGQRPPQRWDKARDLIEALGGDPAEHRNLWEAASQAKASTWRLRS